MSAQERPETKEEAEEEEPQNTPAGAILAPMVEANKEGKSSADPSEGRDDVPSE